MAAVTICSDSGAQKIKSVTVSIVSPSTGHEVMGLDVMILVFWMLSFKPTSRMRWPTVCFRWPKFSFSISSFSEYLGLTSKHWLVTCIYPSVNYIYTYSAIFSVTVFTVFLSIHKSFSHNVSYHQFMVPNPLFFLRDHFTGSALSFHQEGSSVTVSLVMLKVFDNHKRSCKTVLLILSFLPQWDWAEFAPT